MIFATVTFGTLRGKSREELEDAVETYLVSLLKGGQIGREWLIAWTNGRLNAYLMLAAPRAMASRFNTAWGRKDLAEVVRLFGREPVLKILDDNVGKASSGWRGAPFLYLFTTWADPYSPVCRGDGKSPVPTFNLPVSDSIRDRLYGWQRSYCRLDGVWMESGALEVPAYRQLADPHSELSEEGRKLCRELETFTGISTFYYLMRYCGRSRDEEERLCPSCGKGWKASEPEFGERFHRFHFKCDPCRLVSHVGKSVEGVRRARIGEYAPAKPSSRNTKP